VGARGKPLAAGTWLVDPDRSEVRFEVRHLGLTHVRGRFTRFEGSVRVSRGAVSARGEVEVASVDTGDERRDHYLRTAGEFFDPDRHPRIEFASSPVSAAAQRAFRLEGELTIRGTSRPLSLEVEVEHPAKSHGGEGEIVFSAHGELDRGDYGLRFPAVAGYGDALVGETVKIRIRALLLKHPTEGKDD
jgi:polyisoprenoid-binding protein YceI